MKDNKKKVKSESRHKTAVVILSLLILFLGLLGLWIHSQTNFVTAKVVTDQNYLEDSKIPKNQGVVSIQIRDPPAQPDSTQPVQ